MSDLHVLSGSYVLDALDDRERAQFERHLRTCAECAVEVVEFHEVTAFLGGRVALVPPARFRNTVMDEVAVSRPLPVAGRVRLHRRVRPRIVSAAAIALVLAGVAGLIAGVWVGDRTRDEEQVAASAGASRVTAIARVLADPDRTENGVNGGSARLFSAAGSAVLVVSDLPAASFGNTYQVWLFDDKGVRPVDRLEVRDGFGQVLVPGVSAGSTIAVSVEPGRGSRRPSAEPFLKLRVT
jgi:anti-sigma factor RsiW